MPETTARVGGDLLTALVFAHETGHRLQYATGSYDPRAYKRAELGADCWAGYFLAWQACQGALPTLVADRALSGLCDLYAARDVQQWANIGSCRERTGAIRHGYNGYFSGFNPLAVCR